MSGSQPHVHWIPAGGAAVRAVASIRLRALRPARLLQARGWAASVGGDPPKGATAVVFQKAYEPAHVDLAGRLRARGIRTLLDLCDNHLYVGHGNQALEARAQRLRHMLDAVDDVVVSTPVLGRLLGCDHAVVDDALEELPSPRWRWTRLTPAKRLALVWFGNAGTGDPPFGLVDLATIIPALNDVSGVPFDLTVVSNDRGAYERATAGARFLHRYVSWHSWSALRILRRFDVALLPIQSNPFTMVKTSNRVVTALRSGLAVIADPIPSYEELAPFVRFGSWSTTVESYADASVRRADAQAGAAYAERRFADSVVAAQWLRALAGRTPGTDSQGADR